MSEEHIRLIAKIQHFYDLMVRRLQDLEDNSIRCCNSSELVSYREKFIEINFLMSEYCKTFDKLLYKEPVEKD